jgi:hypothetical protein
LIDHLDALLSGRAPPEPTLATRLVFRRSTGRAARVVDTSSSPDLDALAPDDRG